MNAMKMVPLVEDFANVVSYYSELEEKENRDSRRILESSFSSLQISAQNGVRFDQDAYLAFIQEVIERGEQGRDVVAVLSYIYQYCELITLAEVLQRIPELVRRFEDADLLEWTKIKTNSKLFQKAAWLFVERFEEVFLSLGELSQETAFHIAGISDFYDLDLSPRLKAATKAWVITSKMEGDDQDGSDESSSRTLQ